MRTLPIAIAIAAASSVTTLAAIPDPLVLETIGRERGFPSETITAIHRDGFGFLWVGSREGLAMWDGYEVRVFEHAVSEPTSLSDNAVRRIYEGPSGTLWIGTDAGGLQRLDRASWKFDSFRHDPSDPDSLSHDAVYAIVEEDENTLWVGTQAGLDRLDRRTREFTHFEADAEDPRALPNPWIYDLHRDRQGRIWAATVGGGVAWLDPGSGRFTRVPFAESPWTTERNSLTYSFAEGPSGEIWVAAEDLVYRYDTTSAELVPAFVPDAPPDRAPPIFTSIAFDRTGTLWATTWERGLFAYRPGDDAAKQFRHDPERAEGLATDRNACLFIDSVGDVWIGSWGRGIQRFNSNAGLFSSILAGDGRGALPYHEITSVLEDSRGRLWVGTWGKGLCWRDAPDRPFTCNSEPSLLTPLSVVEEGTGAWVGTMSGLHEVDSRGVVVRSFDAPPEELGSVGRYINAIVFDDERRLWIGSGGAGLHVLGADGSTLVHFRNDPSDAASLSDDYVTALAIGNDGAVWVGTRSGGLNRFDPETERFERFVPDPDSPASLPHHTVTSIRRDLAGTIWVGTAGGGLAHVEDDGRGGWRVTRVGVADGLVNASVVSIEVDDDGSLWIGTRRGLSRYQPESGRFHNYGPGDGLPSLEFRPNASESSETHLHFGTLGGVLSVRRGSRFDVPAPTPTLITAIRTPDGPWPTPNSPWETREITLPYGTMLSFEFDVIDLRPPHRFAYRIEGEGDGWNDLGTRREITFAGLRPGTYALSVRGLNARGVWSESDSPMKVRILPPFWMTWWFRVVALLAIVGLGWTWIHLKVSSLARRNRELETLHRERELALERARESQSRLHEAYERLRGLTRRLEQAKEEERGRIARELHDEMGQALSAVKINLKVLGRLSEQDGVTERVGDALALVDGIIGHVRTLSLDLRPPLLDELGLVAALRGYAEAQSMRSGVAIDVETNAETTDVPADIAITAFRVVQESVHNVLRHAPSARSVTVSVRRDPGRLTVTVRDDGPGFDVPEALERAATGRHLGLLGMRERVESIGGSLEIESLAGEGTTVHAAIPIDADGATR